MALLLRIASLLLIVALTAGCGGAQKPAADPRGTVRFSGEPKDALLSVNEVHLGPIHMFEKSGVRLRPGKQRIMVSKTGYFTEYRLVEVQVDILTTVDISLREIP